MPPVSYREIRASDLQDPNLTELNSLHSDLVSEVNRLGGVYGAVTFISNLDMQGKKILNQGCSEVGTPLQLPSGSEVRLSLSECSQWVEIETESGRKLVVSFGTLVSVFMEAHSLLPGHLIEIGSGGFEKVKTAKTVQRDSIRMQVEVTPHCVYLANGVRIHHL